MPRLWARPSPVAAGLADRIYPWQRYRCLSWAVIHHERSKARLAILTFDHPTQVVALARLFPDFSRASEQLGRGVGARPEAPRKDGCPILEPVRWAQGWDTPRYVVRNLWYPTLRKRREGPRISYCVAAARVACAVFGKENRMEFVDPTRLYRKSGGMGHPQSCCTFLQRRNPARQFSRAW